MHGTLEAEVSVLDHGLIEDQEGVRNAVVVGIVLHLIGMQVASFILRLSLRPVGVDARIYLFCYCLFSLSRLFLHYCRC
jgi:hypothetical protein